MDQLDYSGKMAQEHTTRPVLLIPIKLPTLHASTSNSCSIDDRLYLGYYLWDLGVINARRSDHAISLSEAPTQEERNALVKRLHSSQNGNCFICRGPIDLNLHNDNIDHVEPITSGGKDGPENFALTHDHCNQSKQASNLRVARVLAAFDALARKVEAGRSPHLGHVLSEYGGSKYELRVDLDETSLSTTFEDLDQNEVTTFPVYTDKLSGFRSSFINLPIEYLHHDHRINPRAIGSNLRKLIEEFHKKLPQLHISLGWIDTSKGTRVKVKIFDGQHKAAAQVLLGARTLPVRVFIDPDTDVLLTANTNAGTTLRQVAFDQSVQRRLGSSILIDRINRYRAERGLADDDESWSEQDLVNYFRGEHRQMQRYVVDRVRNSITTHDENKLRDYIEHGGRSSDKPFGYYTIERTFYRCFIHGGVLTTPFNHKIEEGANPRELEIDQTVRLMSIVADKIYIGQFDPGQGTRRIENDIQKGKDVPEGHLRACRMSKEEVAYNWVQLIKQVVLIHFLALGKPIVDDSKIFQREVPEACWSNVENFIDSLKSLPLWVNRDLGISVFGAKRNYEYWETIFEKGETPDGAPVMGAGLDLMEMIKGQD